MCIFFAPFIYSKHDKIVNMRTDPEILQSCMARLRTLEPIRDVIVQPERVALHRRRGSLHIADGTLVLHTDFGQLDYEIEIKKALTSQQLDHLLVRLGDFPKESFLLLTDYVASPMVQRLVEAGVNFIDTAGNAHLHRRGQLYVRVQGLKRQMPADRSPTRLFRPSGLQVLFVLLSKPSYTALPYRELASLSGASLGTVSRVIKELRHKGYLLQTGPKDWALVHYPELLEQWVTGYGERLRAKLVIDRFEAPGNDLELALTKLTESSTRHARTWALTGGWAADILTHHYRGNQLVVFVQNWSHDFIRELKWLPSPNGPITLLRLFSPAILFDTRREESRPVAHPFLVYAELLFQGSERELETAHMIYDKYIRPPQ